MSIDTCHDCGMFVNTDDDPAAYVEIGNMKRLHKEVCICERCRDIRENDLDESNAHPTLAEANGMVLPFDDPARG